MNRLPAALALALLLLPASALHAAQPSRGAVVALTDEYLVVDTDGRGRRLFVLDEVVAPGDLQPGDRVAVGFVVGEDNELHARSVSRVEAPGPEAGARPSGLGAVLAVATLWSAGPLGLALASLTSS